MRLLVTRPEPDAERTAARLRALGHEVLVQPLLRIVHNAAPENPPRPAAILITSQNAVRAMAAWPQAAAWTGVPVFAAGAATAAAARELGFATVHAGDGDAASLADLVLAVVPLTSGPLLYPAARDRSGALAGGLTARGYDVRVVEAYRAEPAVAFDPPVMAALVAGSLEGVLVYSARTAEALFAAAERSGVAAVMPRLVFFAISTNVAAKLRAVGAVTVRVAKEPSEDSLIALIPAAR